MRCFVRSCALAVIGLLLVNGPVGSQEKKEDPAARMKTNMPGPVHKQLAKRVGEYTTVSKLSLRPGEAPTETKGTAKITSVLGERFLMEENTGTMLGQEIKGIRFYGYNNATKQYEATWAYTMSTGMLSMTGTSKDDGKTVNYTATYINEVGVKETLLVATRQIDEDHFVVELTGTLPDGSKGPTLETTYTRKK